MTIAPIIKTVTVGCDPARAFSLFTAKMGQWWPAGKTVGAAPHVTIIIEPTSQGRWFERDAEGHETQWGKVLEWDPPRRLLLAWQLTTAWVFDPDFVTEVELTFMPAADGGCLVTLEHRHLQRFGVDAEKMADSLGGGWPGRLAEFAAFADIPA